MTQKRLADLFNAAYEKSEIAERGRFDTLMQKDDRNCPSPVLADLLYEIILLSKDIKALQERLDALDESY